MATTKEKIHTGEAEAPGDKQNQGSVYSALFSEFNDALVGMIKRMGLTQAEAEEVAQESYVRMLGLKKATGASGYLRAYLFRVATNLTIDKLRRHNISPVLPGTNDLCSNRPDPSPSPERVVAAQQSLMQIEEVIANLPEKRRTAFILYRVKGLDSSDVAKHMGISKRMVRKHVMKAAEACLDAIKNQL